MVSATTLNYVTHPFRLMFEYGIELLNFIGQCNLLLIMLLIISLFDFFTSFSNIEKKYLDYIFIIKNVSRDDHIVPVILTVIYKMIYQ